MKKSRSIFIILLVLIFTVTGCGKKSNPEDIVTECFNNIQQGQFNQIGKYMAGYSEEDTNIIGEGNELFNDALKKMEYEILETNVEEKTAVVKTKVTILDMLDLNSQIMRLLVEGIIGGQDIESKEFREKLKEDIDLDSLEKITSEIDIELQEGESQWLIVGGETFLDAITGNMLKAIQSFQEQQTTGN